MARSSTSFAVGGGNPKGRKPKTQDQRDAEAFLSERTMAAAQRLVQLQASDDEKVALAACTTHLKVTLGEHIRTETRDVTEDRPLRGLSVADVREALALWRARKAGE